MHCKIIFFSLFKIECRSLHQLCWILHDILVTMPVSGVQIVSLKLSTNVDINNLETLILGVDY